MNLLNNLRNSEKSSTNYVHLKW